MRPTSDSETPFISWNCYGPVSQNIPFDLSDEDMRDQSTQEIGADLLTPTFRRQGDPEKRICAQVLRFCAKKCSYQPVAPNQQYDRKERTTCSRPLLYCAR